MRDRVRRLLFERLVFNLAVVLGLAQALAWHWAGVVLLRGDTPDAAQASAAAGLLVAVNVLAVPRLRAARRRAGLAGAVARTYMEAGVATLLLGVTIAATWVVFGLLAGLLGVMGASSETAFTVFRACSVASVGSVAGALAWGFSIGQARVERTQLRVAVPGLPEALRGLRIVQISDLHIGNGLEGRRLERMVARTNALDPDVIVVTGDIFDYDPVHIEAGARRLAGLRARHGVYAVLGNHDHHAGADAVAEGLARHAPGVRLLRDELVPLPVGAPLYLAGVDDPGRDWSARGLELDGLERVSRARPGDGPTLLLAHRPEVFPQAARLGFPLVLSGHTHGGQLALPARGGRYNLASLVTRFTRGLYRENGSTLYVNRGLGVGGPALRFHCPREIATLTLV